METQVIQTTSTNCSLHDHSSILGLKRSGNMVWGLRNDVRRAILYECMEDIQGINRVGYIHPAEAVLIAHFNGRRTIQQVETEIAEAFDIPPEAACAEVDSLLKRWGDCFDPNCGPDVPQYNPQDFVVPAEEIDLTSRRLYKPLSLLLHVSDDCMRKCIYCNVEKRPTKSTRELSLARIEELIAEMKRIPTVTTILGGGDPFMRREIMEILQMFFDAKVKFFLTTKSHITRTRAEQLARMGLKQMQISIDAPTAELADFLVGTPGFFHHALDSIRNLRDCGIQVRTNTVLTSHSIQYAHELVTLLAGLGVETIQLGPVGRSLYTDSEGLLCNFDDVLRLDEQLPEIRNQLPLGVKVNFSYSKDNSLVPVEERAANFPKRAVCSAGRWAMIVLSDGKVILCDELQVKDEHIIGDVTTQSLMEVWHSSRMKDFIFPQREQFQGTACFDCPDFEACHTGPGRCFRDALKAYGSLHAPAPGCPRAPQGPRLT